MSNIVILSEDKVIDGVQRVKGEIITVDDEFDKRVIKEVIEEVPDEQPAE